MIIQWILQDYPLKLMTRPSPLEHNIKDARARSYSKMAASMGKILKQLIQVNKPLPILGAINAYSAMLAQFAGAKAIYLSGAGVANASYGLPDLGMTNLSQVLEDARRITEACPLPLLVDVDT